MKHSTLLSTALAAIFALPALADPQTIHCGKVSDIRETEDVSARVYLKDYKRIARTGTHDKQIKMGTDSYDEGFNLQPLQRPNEHALSLMSEESFNRYSNDQSQKAAALKVRSQFITDLKDNARKPAPSHVCFSEQGGKVIYAFGNSAEEAAKLIK